MSENKQNLEATILYYCKEIEGSLVRKDIFNKFSMMFKLDANKEFRVFIAFYVWQIGELFKSNEDLQKRYPNFDYEQAFNSRDIIYRKNPNSPNNLGFNGLSNLVFDGLPLLIEQVTNSIKRGNEHEMELPSS